MFFDTYEDFSFQGLSADFLHGFHHSELHAIANSGAIIGAAINVDFAMLTGFVGSHNRAETPNGASLTTMATTADSEDPIVIIGKRPPLPDLDGGGLGSGGSTGGGSTGGGGGGGDGGATDTQADPTPCVETSTSSAPGATQQEINNAALAASRAIAAKNDETYEYSSIIYSLNGQVGYTPPYTQNSPDSVNFLGGIGSVPTGAVIVGIVHNHPNDPAIDDRIPSGGLNAGADWSAYNQVVNYNRDHATDLPRSITVDPNMLLYIYSDEDRQTHVYDNTDKSQTTASCSL